MSFGIFKNDLIPTSLETYFSLCPEATGQTRIWARTLRHCLPKIRILHFTSAFRSVGASEMTPVEGGLCQALGVPFEWWVVGTSHAYNRLENRIVKAIHADPEDFVPFTEEDTSLFHSLSEHLRETLAHLVQPTDAVVCHDPTLLPLVPELLKLTPRVMWRCHGGSEIQDEVTEAVWSFLKPYLSDPQATFCFSRSSFAPSFLPKSRLMVIRPFIQPESLKNCDLPEASCLQIYNALLGRRPQAHFTHASGSIIIDQPAQVWGKPPEHPQAVPIICQIGWWDRLKDHVGVLHMFRDHFAQFPESTTLFLVGPTVKPQRDSNTELDTWHDLIEAWKLLPPEVKDRVVILALPNENRTRNALMVNALQRLSRVIIQKSIQEGFGLTVTEALWKGKPVVGTSIGGIQDQIIHAQTGYLLDNPFDHATCAQIITDLLQHPQRCEAFGQAARHTVKQRFLAPHALRKYLHGLIQESPRPHLRRFWKSAKRADLKQPLSSQSL